MKLALALAALLLLFTAPARACSVFSVEQGGVRVMARNFDWHDGDGYLLYSPAGQARRADSGYAWTAALPSLTFHLYAQQGETASIGGVNSKGLAIEAVWLKEADYGQAPGARLSAPEWITYNLDNFSSVREVLARAPGLPISGSPEPLHFMGCDPRECFVLEYLGGKLKVYSGGALSYAALTNAAYGKALAALPEFKGFGGDREMAGNSPLPRFARAAYFLTNAQAPSSAAVRSALDSLRIASGHVATKWSYIYDLSSASVSFDTGRFYSLPDLAAQGGPANKLPLPY